jgi:hypothetical protein
MNLVWYFLSQTNEILNIDSTVAGSLLKDAQEKTPQTLNSRHWRFIGHSTFGFNDEGDLRLSYEDNNDNIFSLPLADLDGRIYSWPTAILGPVIETKDLYALPPQTPRPISSSGFCGTSCSGAADCPSNTLIVDLDLDLDPVASCHCIPATQNIQEYFNLDAIFPALGVCLTAAAMAAVAQSMPKDVQGLEGSSEQLIGRDLVKSGQSEAVQLQCLCNATFVAEACCYSATGVL